MCSPAGQTRAASRRTRFELTLTKRAKIDFAVAEPTVNYELELHAAKACKGLLG